MPGNLLMAEEYRRLLCEFTVGISPDYVPARATTKDAGYDPLRLRPVAESAGCIDKLLAAETDVPMAWRLGEFWALGGQCLVTARALSAPKIGEVLDVAHRNQALLTNVRTISHRPRNNGELAVVHNGEMAQDPVARFLFHAVMASKLTHLFHFYQGSQLQHHIDRRAQSFGQLMERFDSELDFVEIECREGELTMGFGRELLETKVAESDGRLIAALDRELSRRVAELPETGRWKDRIKYYIRSNHLSEISLDEICDTFRVQRRTLGRLLRDEGTTFTSILTELRRERALHLVRNSEVPLKRVAGELGFNSDASFSMAFKSWTGMTPMAYRKSSPARSPSNDARPVELALAVEAKKSLRSSMLLSSWSQRPNA